MELKDIKSVYFIGAGGIGMSALARYFMHKGVVVAGYDKTPSALTAQLEKEGMLLHYEEDVDSIPQACRNASSCLVVYTPAIPSTHKELVFFSEHGFEIEKRAQVLGTLTRTHKGLCVAGTHGKTTTSAICAHIMHQSHLDSNAFLGGILKNYGTNYILSRNSDYVVIEADEFDRSFHWLRPWISVITATDPDHLDIYGTKEAYLESFAHFTELIQPGGALICHTGLKLQPRVRNGVKTYFYSRDEGDFHAVNIRKGDGEIVFDFVSPEGVVKDVKLGVPVDINIENAVASMAVCALIGIEGDVMREAMASFLGAKRRFEFWMKEPGAHGHVVIDDYAHHPKELEVTLKAAMDMGYRRVIAIFQPFTYSRTVMLFDDFIRVLQIPDQVVLSEIMGSREINTYHIYSANLCEKLPGAVWFDSFEKIADYVAAHAQPGDLVITLGCGDIYKAARLVIQKLCQTE